MASKWSAKVNVYTGADAVTATLGTLAAAGKQLRTNTDVAWTNEPLGVFANNDIIRAVISPYGGLYRMQSDASLLLYGGYDSQDVLVGLSRADQGESSAQVIQMAATSDNWLYAGQLFIDTNASSTGAAGSYNAQIQLLANNATKTMEIQSRIGTEVGAFISMLSVKAQSEAFNFRISDEDGVVTQFSPMVADGGGVIAYLLNTSNVLGNATAQILSIKNNGTETEALYGNGKWTLLTNRTIFNPAVADAPGTEVYRFDTTNTLTDDTTKLLMVANNGTTQLIVSKNGGLALGKNASGIFSGPPVDGRLILGARDVADGDPNGCGIAFLVQNGASIGEFNALQTSLSSVLVVSQETAATTSGLNMNAGVNTALFQLLIAGNTKTKMEPSVANGATAVAYLFDTSNALSNADARIASLKNNGIEVVAIRGTGGIAVGRNIDGAWGPGDNDVLSGWHDVSEGESASSFVFVGSGATDNINASAAYLDFETSAVSTTPRIDHNLVVRSAGQAETSLHVDLTTAPVAIVTMTVVDEVGFILQPSVADGAVTVYRLNTYNNLTNASALVLSCQNQSTHVFDVFANGSIKTGTPNGGTAGQWKLGIRVAATTALDTTQYLQVDIAGTLYKVGLVTS